jgi:hypothetical protein
MQAEASKVAGGEVMTQEERINELEKKLNDLEVKLMNTLCLLKDLVMLDRGLDNNKTKQLVEHIEYVLRS